MKAISVKNLTKKYKDLVAVDNISFDIEEGCLFSLLGVNGAGKSTTIKMLSLLIKPTSGKIIIDGKDMSKEPLKIKEVLNISPQESAVALNLTVKENLYFMAGVYSVKDKDKKINELVKLFKLDKVLNKRAKQLSGGYQRRLSIALALINDPKILFLDEPTLGLDVLARKELWNIINNLKGKMTIILTTHYMEEAESLSDEVGIINEGKIIKMGKVKDITKGFKNLEEAFIKEVGNYEND